MSRIAVLGGTFDPPHLGHLILAEQARVQLNAERVLWVPAADPPHKQDQSISPIAHRLEMLRLAVEDNPAFELSLIDVERPGPHYSVAMLGLLQEIYPHTALFFLIGADSLRDLPTWHRPDQLINLATLAVMQRPWVHYDLTELEKSIPGIHSHLKFLDAPRIDISGREIRGLVAQQRSARYLLPDSVMDYIEQTGLYQADFAR